MTQPNPPAPPPKDTAHRYSPTLVLGLTCIALVIIIAAVSIIAISNGSDASSAAKDASAAAKAAQAEVVRQDVLLAKVNDVVGQLQAANAQRDATSKGQTLALAEVVEGIARGFATPPYPDPDRTMAVQGLCDTAATFRAAAGVQPEQCP